MNEFEAGIVALLPRLRRYARSLSADRDDADDLLQQCLENALARRPTWRGENLAAWLMAIMTNLSRNRHRSRRRAGAAGPSEDETELPAAAGEQDPLERDRLAAAIDRLDPDQRAVLMLVVVEGYTYAEVAAMLEIPLGTVMSRLSRARRGVAERLREDNIIPLRRP